MNLSGDPTDTIKQKLAIVTGAIIHSAGGRDESPIFAVYPPGGWYLIEGTLPSERQERSTVRMLGKTLHLAIGA
jgi:hypothetical protein